jgi:hypothetical protein
MTNTPQQLSPVLRKSLKSGLITAGAVAENDYPMDAVLESLNFHFDTIGKMTLRKGTTLLGNALSGDILGLYNFRDSGSGTNNQLIMVNSSNLYYLATTTWTAKRSGLTSGSKARFSTLLDYVFMVNGTEATAIWDGNPSNNFVTTGNASGAPIGKYIENYRARMWIAGNSDYPDRVYYSSTPSAVTTPVITWDTSVTTGQWIDISPSDGENITSLHRTKNALLVFKNNHIYNIFSINQVDPDPKFNVGTYSNESVVETKNGVYFHHPTGFYRYNGEVTEVSRPIIDIVNAITLTNYSKVAGYLEPDGDHIRWSIGDVTYGGVAYANMEVRYTISSQVWTHYSGPTQFLVGAPYNNGSTLVTVVGDESGQIQTIESGLTDNGTEILYSIIHPFDDIDGSHSTLKIITKMFFMHSGMNGTNVNYQTPEDILNDFTKGIAQLESSEKGFKVDVRGRKIKVKLSGSSKGQPCSYEGLQWDSGTTQEINYV